VVSKLQGVVNLFHNARRTLKALVGWLVALPREEMAFAKVVAALYEAGSALPDASVLTKCAGYINTPALSREVDHGAALLIQHASIRDLHPTSQAFEEAKMLGNAALSSVSPDLLTAISCYTAAVSSATTGLQRAIALCNRSSALLVAGRAELAAEDALAACAAHPVHAKAFYRLHEALRACEHGSSDEPAHLASALLGTSASPDALRSAAQYTARICCALVSHREAGVSVPSVVDAMSALLPISRASTPAVGSPASGPRADLDTGSCCWSTTVVRDSTSVGRGLIVVRCPVRGEGVGAAAGAPQGSILLREEPVAAVPVLPTPTAADWLAFCDPSKGPASHAPAASGRASSVDLWASPRCTYCLRALPLLQLGGGAARPYYCIPCSGACSGGPNAAAWCSAACMLRDASDPAAGHGAVCAEASGSWSGGRSRGSCDAAASGGSGRLRIAAALCRLRLLPAEVELALRCMAAADASREATGAGPDASISGAACVSKPDESGVLALDGHKNSSMAARAATVPAWLLEGPLPPLTAPSSQDAPVKRPSGRDTLPGETASDWPLQSLEGAGCLPEKQATELAATAALTHVILVMAQQLEAEQEEVWAAESCSPAGTHAAGGAATAAAIRRLRAEHASAPAVSQVVSDAWLGGAGKRQNRPPAPPCPRRLAHWLCVLACNAHGVKDVVATAVAPLSADHVERGRGKGAGVLELTVGLALYHRGSFANHACAPTTHSRFDGRTLELVSLCALPPGAPVTISYGPTALEDPRPRPRRELLQRKYGFVCACSACTAPPTILREIAAGDAEMRRYWAAARAAAEAADFPAAVALQEAFVHLREARLGKLRALLSGSETRTGEREDPAELAFDLLALVTWARRGPAGGGGIDSTRWEAAAAVGLRVLLPAGHPLRGGFEI
jgi:hypothetical protein